MTRIAMPDSVPESEAINQGHQQASTEVVKETEKSRLKLHQLTQNSQRVLFSTQSVFPFSIFPSRIIIDATKVSILEGGPTGVAQTHSVYIADITDVSVSSSLFFAALEIHIGFTQKFIKVSTLKKADAQKARRIIQGLIIAVKQQIDLSKFDNLADLANHIDTLGAAQTI